MKKVVKKQQESNIWDEVSLILSSSWRLNVLKELDSPKKPSQLTKKLKMPYSHISKTLNQLKDHNLINILTPNKTQGRLYIITEEGKKVLLEAEKIIGKKDTKSEEF